MELKRIGTGYYARKFIKQESSGGIVLILVTIVAVIWANSSYYDSYHHLWHEFDAGVIFGDFRLVGSLHHWVNDGLMALFFFNIGLEIKREVVAGQLSTVRKASLPIAAAIGGMFVPALIYVIVNYDNPQAIDGWGIPMATDIAFTLGLMSLLGSRVNPQLKIFVTALAIADDLGAILIIAFFYTETIDMTELITAILFLGILIGANAIGIRKTAFYALVGLIGVWLSFLYSGIHSTIAGVLIAMTIPSKPKMSGGVYIDKLRKTLLPSSILESDQTSMLSEDQAHTLKKVSKLTEDAESPSLRLEHYLHPFSTFLILPLFALANAGVRIEGDLLGMILHPISLGIIFGLVLGKFLGISFFTWLATALKLSSLPDGVKMKEIMAAAMLAGIGFTMSLFISELAFQAEESIQIAKVGIFTASIVAAVIGMIMLRFASSSEET
jgi:NhaA family Na+:H+ antiporter